MQSKITTICKIIQKTFVVIVIFFIMVSCQRNKADSKRFVAIDSIKFSNYSKYSCGIDKRTISFYLTCDNEIKGDSILLQADTTYAKLFIIKSKQTFGGWQYVLEYTNKDFSVSSLRELQEKYKSITTFKEGILRYNNGDIIYWVLPSLKAAKVFYLNNKKVIDPYSLEFEEEVPFVPLEVPTKPYK